MRSLSKPTNRSESENGGRVNLTDEQFKQLQAIFNLSRRGHPATAEMVENAATLIEAGLVELSGDADLSIPDEAQQMLAANGRLLKLF